LVYWVLIDADTPDNALRMLFVVETSKRTLLLLMLKHTLQLRD